MLAVFVYAAFSGLLPLFNRTSRVGGFLNSCVLTLGTPALTIFVTLAAARAVLHPPRTAAAGAASVHGGAGDIATILVLGILLCLALVVIEFANVDTRGLPVYLTGIVTLRLYFAANATHAPVFSGFPVTFGIFALVAVAAILLGVAAEAEAADLAGALRSTPDDARKTAKICLRPTLNFIAAIVGVCTYAAVTTLR